MALGHHQKPLCEPCLNLLPTNPVSTKPVAVGSAIKPRMNL